ncbi:MAG TPA: ABC transporter permease subunit [Bacillota bacterium]|nr:ABC transporter permease subunit [Bacillota bacterium]
MNIFMYVLFGLPCLLLLIQSFAFDWRWPAMLPQVLSLRAWQVVFSEVSLWPVLGTTFLIGCLVVVLNLVLALPAGKALAHHDFRGKTMLELFLLLPILIPTLAVAMGIFLVMLRLGLTDKLTGVVLVQLIPTLPYSIRIFRAAFESLGVKWEEQAKTLGVNPGKVWLTVWLPMLVPSINNAAMLAFLISLSQYALTAIIGGGSVATLPMLYFPYFEAANRAVTAAFTILFAVLPLCFFLLLRLALRLLVPNSTTVRGLEDGLF